MNIEFGQRQIGEESIINNPYESYSDYLVGNFPSGQVNDVSYLSGRIQYWFKSNISIISSLEWSESTANGRKFQFNLGFDVFYPINFKIK